jgi:cell division septation protein DedD
MSGCEMPQDDGQTFQRMAARLNEIELDEKPKDGVPPAEPKSNAQKLDLVVDTAKSIAIGPEGLITEAPAFKIKIVDALDMIEDKAVSPLDVRPNSPTLSEAQAENSRLALPIDTSEFKTVQIGSFSNPKAAEAAWQGLQARISGLDTYKSILEPVKTAKGQTLIRLRVGPVTSTEQAQALCQKLEVKDNWCVKTLS